MKKAIKSLAFTLAMLMVISIIQICTIGLFASEAGSMQLISAENAASTITNSTVNIGDVNFRGGSQQIGYFNAPAEMLPFDSGIVLTTGDVGNIFKCSNASSSFGFAGFDRITKLYNESGFRAQQMMLLFCHFRLRQIHLGCLLIIFLLQQNIINQQNTMIFLLCGL